MKSIFCSIDVFLVSREYLYCFQREWFEESLSETNHSSSLKEFLGTRVPSFKLINDVVDELGLVCTRERHVVEAWDRLPVLNSITDGVSDDLSLLLIAEMVVLADPHGNGDLIYSVKWDLLSLITNFIVLLELLEALLDGALSVVKG